MRRAYELARRIPTWLFLMGAVWLTLVGASDAHAQVEDPDERPSIVISPHTRVFEESLDGREAVEASRALYRGSTSYAASHDDVLEHVSREDLEVLAGEVDDAELHLNYAKLAAKSGMKAYKALETDQAVENLKTAREEFDYLYLDLLEPQRAAQVSLYLALSYLEQERQTLELVRQFQRMILLDPRQQIRAGLYPEAVVEAFESARDFLIEDLKTEGPDRADATRLTEFAEADYAAFVYAFPAQGGRHEVMMWLYSAEEERFLKPESIEIERADPASLEEASNRLMSRYLPCCLQAPEEERGIQSASGKSPFSLQVEFAYASFLRFPPPVYPEREGFPPDRRSMFGNAGIGIHGTYLLTREFGVTMGFQILNSITDYNGRLREDFTTLRAFGGGDLGVEFGNFNFGASFSLEIARLDDFTAWEDESCVVRTDCGPSAYATFDDFDFMMGVNARPRLIWRFFQTYHAVASVDVTYYFVPLSGNDLNFPVTTQLGVLYRF
ncbi:MAG: hypothetical protein ACQEVA_17955 [Myxococcota bacterium]